MANLTLSSAGEASLKKLEGFRAVPYKDGGGIWTIGFGETLSEADVHRFANNPMTEEACINWLRARCYGISELLHQLKLDWLAPHQTDALILLIYNIGEDAFRGSTIARQILRRSIDLSSWTWWEKDARWHIEPGLQIRREEELRLFIYGIYP